MTRCPGCGWNITHLELRWYGLYVGMVGMLSSWKMDGVSNFKIVCPNCRQTVANDIGLAENMVRRG